MCIKKCSLPVVLAHHALQVGGTEKVIVSWSKVSTDTKTSGERTGPTKRASYKICFIDL